MRLTIDAVSVGGAAAFLLRMVWARQRLSGPKSALLFAFVDLVEGVVEDELEIGSE